MSRKEFNIEFVVRGRIAVDPEKVDEICRRIADNTGAASPVGISLQNAVIETILSNQELLNGFLLRKAAFAASELFSEDNRNREIPNLLEHDEFIQHLANALPSAQRKTVLEMIEDNFDIEENLPVIFEPGRGNSWGCIEVCKPFQVDVAAISENK